MCGIDLALVVVALLCEQVVEDGGQVGRRALRRASLHGASLQEIGKGHLDV